jgi:hypothetical protein
MIPAPGPAPEPALKPEALLDELEAQEEEEEDFSIEALAAPAPVGDWGPCVCALVRVFAAAAASIASVSIMRKFTHSSAKLSPYRMGTNHQLLV